MITLLSYVQYTAAISHCLSRPPERKGKNNMHYCYNIELFGKQQETKQAKNTYACLHGIYIYIAHDVMLK